MTVSRVPDPARCRAWPGPPVRSPLRRRPSPETSAGTGCRGQSGAARLPSASFRGGDRHGILSTMPVPGREGYTLTSGTGAQSWRMPRSGTMPVASYRPPFKVRPRHVWMVSFGGFGVAQISMLSQVRCSARKARQAYATRVLSVRLFSAPFLSDFCAKTTCTPLDQFRTLLALAVGIGAGVERVLQDGDDAAIADRRPVNAHQLLAIGRTRKVHLVSGQRQ